MAECPDLQQLFISLAISRTINMAISMKAETHVMILNTTRKFVTATTTSVTHRQTDNLNLNVLIVVWSPSCYIYKQLTITCCEDNTPCPI